MQEIWRGSDPRIPVGDARAWRLRSGSVVIMGWWTAAVVSKGLFWIGGLMAVLSMTSLLSPIALLSLAFLTSVLVGLMQIELIRETSSRQEKLFARRTATAKKALAAGLAIVDAQPAPPLFPAKVEPAATN